MNQAITNRRNKNIAFLVIFIGIVIFQFTELKYIWGISGIGRFYNILFLITISFYIVLNIGVRKLSNNIWIYYILPGALVFIGIVINVTINTIRDPVFVTHYGSLLPWVTYLAVPFLLKDNIINTKKLLGYYYFSTLLITTIGLFEYFLYSNCFIGLQTLYHPNGVFLSGWFSILHLLESGSGHYRFYASIGEPGNLGMILIPSVIYSMLYKRYLGASVLIFGIYLTSSLGAFISISIIMFLLPILLYNRRTISLFTVIFFTVFILSTVVINWDRIYNAYEKKGASARIREDNFKNVINNFQSILIDNVGGLDFSTNYSKKTWKGYYGSNFMPLNAIYEGGVISGVGYMVVVIIYFITAISFFVKKYISREDIVYSLSIIALMPYLVQRGAFLETSLLVLLIAPFVIRNISSYKEKIYGSIGL